MQPWLTMKQNLKMTILSFTFLFAVLSLITSCNKEKENVLKDPRDGKSYTTVSIGSQIWMSQNLNYDTGNSWCYDQASANCNAFGRLYDWQTAQTACPPGWKLPSFSDFETLLIHVYDNGLHQAFSSLMFGGSSGFNALLGGMYNQDNEFSSLHSSSTWWSETKETDENPWCLHIANSPRVVYMFEWSTSLGLSVRCIKK